MFLFLLMLTVAVFVPSFSAPLPPLTSPLFRSDLPHRRLGLTHEESPLFIGSGSSITETKFRDEPPKKEQNFASPLQFLPANRENQAQAETFSVEKAAETLAEFLTKHPQTSDTKTRRHIVNGPQGGPGQSRRDVTNEAQRRSDNEEDPSGPPAYAAAGEIDSSSPAAGAKPKTSWIPKFATSAVVPQAPVPQAPVSQAPVKQVATTERRRRPNRNHIQTTEDPQTSIYPDTKPSTERKSPSDSTSPPSNDRRRGGFRPNTTGRTRTRRPPSPRASQQNERVNAAPTEGSRPQRRQRPTRPRRPSTPSPVTEPSTDEETSATTGQREVHANIRVRGQSPGQRNFRPRERVRGTLTRSRGTRNLSPDGEAQHDESTSKPVIEEGGEAVEPQESGTQDSAAEQTSKNKVSPFDIFKRRTRKSSSSLIFPSGVVSPSQPEQTTVSD